MSASGDTVRAVHKYIMLTTVDHLQSELSRHFGGVSIPLAPRQRWIAPKKFILVESPLRVRGNARGLRQVREITRGELDLRR